MSSRPTDLPEWATDGGADIVEPSLGQKQLGWAADQAPPAGYFNWWKNLVYQWIAHERANSLCAVFEISGSGVTPGSAFTLAFGNDGQDPAEDNSLFTLGSNQIQVPHSGVYRVDLAAQVENASTANPKTVSLGLAIASGETYYLTNKRFSATASDSILISGSILLTIVNPATNLISVVNGDFAGSNESISTEGGASPRFNRLCVSRIRSGT